MEFFHHPPSISQPQPHKASSGLGIKLWERGGRNGRVSSVGFAMQWNSSQQDGRGHPLKATGTVLKVDLRVESRQGEWPIPGFIYCPPGWASTEQHAKSL